MNTQLILVEGLPGFGKSTTAKLIEEYLSENKIMNELILEGNLDHPADYDGVAYFTHQKWSEFLSKHSDSTNVMLKHCTEKPHGMLIPYQKMKNQNLITDDIYNRISKNDIYELPLTKHIELITERWREFAKEAITKQTTYIFECCFIQNPITMGMIRGGTEKEIVTNYVDQLAEIIQPLNPVLIYIEQEDLSFSFKKAIQERPKDWSQGFTTYYTTQGYGLKKGLVGVEGTIEVLEERLKLERDIYQSLKLSKYILNNSLYEKESYKLKLSRILGNHLGLEQPK
jgi:hypothetical protein